MTMNISEELRAFIADYIEKKGLDMSVDLALQKPDIIAVARKVLKQKNVEAHQQEFLLMRDLYRDSREIPDRFKRFISTSEVESHYNHQKNHKGLILEDYIPREVFDEDNWFGVLLQFLYLYKLVMFDYSNSDKEDLEQEAKIGRNAVSNALYFFAHYRSSDLKEDNFAVGRENTLRAAKIILDSDTLYTRIFAHSDRVSSEITVLSGDYTTDDLKRAYSEFPDALFTVTEERTLDTNFLVFNILLKHVINNKKYSRDSESVKIYRRADKLRRRLHFLYFHLFGFTIHRSHCPRRLRRDFVLALSEQQKWDEFFAGRSPLYDKVLEP